MGRRRKRSSSDAEGDSLEREYIIRRQKSLKNKVNASISESQTPSTSSSSSSSVSVTLQAEEQPKKSKEINHNQKSNGEKKEENVSQQKEKGCEKIERMRLKKRRKKELQKEKKRKRAEAAAEQLAKETQQKEVKKQEKEKKELTDRKIKSSISNNRFITTHRGVQYCDIIVGEGPVVQDRKKVRVSYKLRAKHKTGKIIDSSKNFGFRMGKGEVIPGWEIGLLRMRQGGTRHLIIPPNAGYGNRNIGAGSGALLYFEVTLLSC